MFLTLSLLKTYKIKVKNIHTKVAYYSLFQSVPGKVSVRLVNSFT